MPMIPPQPPRGGRSCANCACFYELPHPKNPLERQGFCARQPAIVGQVRMQVPRLDKEGKAVLSRMDQKPVMDSIEDIAFTHQPTTGSLVCMDGWRPIGTRPGERAHDVRLRAMLRAIEPLVTNEDPDPELVRQAIGASLAAYLVDEPAAANDPAPAEDPAAGKLDS